MPIEINKVYTRSGDKGRTGLATGDRRLKSDLRVCTYGDIDSSNAFIGSLLCEVRSQGYEAEYQQLLEIQQNLFNLGAEIASLNFDPSQAYFSPVTMTSSEELEQWMDKMNENLPALSSFVLPGSSEVNARVHLCRTAVRNSERLMVELHQAEPLRDEVLSYINRLSDYFFVLARHFAKKMDDEEILWKTNF